MNKEEVLRLLLDLFSTNVEWRDIGTEACSHYSVNIQDVCTKISKELRTLEELKDLS